MKKDRQRRALDRLVIAPMAPHPKHYTPAQRLEREKLYAAYVARKEEERDALKRSLGLHL